MNVIFTWGGTGGHINPAIALADLLRQRDPQCNILFIGAKGRMEEKLVPQAGYEVVCLPSVSFTRGKNLKALGKNLQGAVKIADALVKCKKVLKDFKPDVIVGTGGYASFPALFLGSRMGIPTCVHEANAVPGLTTRLVADRVDKVLVCFEESARYYKHPEKVQVVGMPVRREFAETDPERARMDLGLDSRPLIVSAFGSQGAREMNKAVAEMFVLEAAAGMPYQHIHATGTYGWEWMPDYVRSLGVNPDACEGLDMREYIYNMPVLMAAADVIISRAGASTLNEIGVSGTPCVIIPSPNVTDNHQEKNARVLEKRGAALVLLEKEATGERLYREVSALLDDKYRRERMREALLDCVPADAADRMVKLILELAKK